MPTASPITETEKPAYSTKPPLESNGKPFFFTHLILDCDGVMVDSERPSCEALRRAILHVTGFDIPHKFPDDFRPLFGMDVRSCVEYYRAKFQKTDWVDDDETLAAKVSATKEGIYKDLTSKGVVAFPGVKDLVDAATGNVVWESQWPHLDLQKRLHIIWSRRGSEGSCLMGSW